MNNEQMVTNARSEILKIKNKYQSFFQEIANSDSLPTQENLLQCHILGLEYFNYFETFVTDSSLLNAHNNGLWITGLAEDCASVLDLYVTHYVFMKKYLQHFIEPSDTAFANMQRIIKSYLPLAQYKKIENMFIQHELPIQGFQYQGAKNMQSEPIWKTLMLTFICVVFIIAILTSSILIPQPTPTQFFVFRLLLAIAAAGIGASIPGFLSLESRMKSFSIRATGASALFVIVWFVNPPSLV